MRSNIKVSSSKQRIKRKRAKQKKAKGNRRESCAWSPVRSFRGQRGTKSRLREQPSRVPSRPSRMRLEVLERLDFISIHLTSTPARYNDTITTSVHCTTQTKYLTMPLAALRTIAKAQVSNVLEQFRVGSADTFWDRMASAHSSSNAKDSISIIATGLEAVGE